MTYLTTLLHYRDYTLRLSYCLSSCWALSLLWYHHWSSLCSYGCITTFPRWYIFEETILCIWTAALYIESLRIDMDKAWYDMFSSKFHLAAHLLWILCFQFGRRFFCYVGLGSFSSYYRWKDFVGVILLAVLIFILIFLLLLWLFHS